MAPSPCLTPVETPSEPLRPWPPAADGQVLPPGNFHTSGAVASRNLVRLSVVPESSDRSSGLICVEGSFSPELSLAIAGSFHVLILPAKMPAIVLGASWRPSTPLRL